MEGIILISLISYIDMMLMIVYMYKGPGHWKLLWQVWLPRQILLLLLWLYFIIFIIEVEPVLQDTTGEELNRGTNATLDVWLDIVAGGILGEAEVSFLWCEGLPPESRFL